jgi:hypothetical protein
MSKRILWVMDSWPFWNLIIIYKTNVHETCLYQQIEIIIICFTRPDPISCRHFGANFDFAIFEIKPTWATESCWLDGVDDVIWRTVPLASPEIVCSAYITRLRTWQKIFILKINLFECVILKHCLFVFVGDFCYVVILTTAFRNKLYTFTNCNVLS